MRSMTFFFVCIVHICASPVIKADDGYERGAMFTFGTTSLPTADVLQNTGLAVHGTPGSWPFGRFGTGFHINGSFGEKAAFDMSITGQSCGSAACSMRFRSTETTARMSQKVSDSLLLGYTSQVSDKVARFAFDFAWQPNAAHRLGGMIYNAAEDAGDDLRGGYVTYTYTRAKRFELYTHVDYKRSSRAYDILWNTGVSLRNNNTHASLTADVSSAVSGTRGFFFKNLTIAYTKRF